MFIILFHSNILPTTNFSNKHLSNRILQHDINDESCYEAAHNAVGEQAKHHIVAQLK
jgi:hypothetical protein